MRTSSQPGLTRKTSERLRLNEEPRIYAVDSPGVMMPYLGRGEEGKERAIKLALIGESMMPNERKTKELMKWFSCIQPVSRRAYTTTKP